MISHHVFEGQILQADDIILSHQVCGQFVEHILPLVYYVLMETSNLKPCLFLALAPLCFSGELPLEPDQFLLGLD